MSSLKGGVRRLLEVIMSSLEGGWRLLEDITGWRLLVGSVRAVLAWPLAWLGPESPLAGSVLSASAATVSAGAALSPPVLLLLSPPVLLLLLLLLLSPSVLYLLLFLLSPSVSGGLGMLTLTLGYWSATGDSTLRAGDSGD